MKVFELTIHFYTTLCLVKYKRFCFANNIVDDALEEYKELIQQFERNFLYEHSGSYTQEERVKTFAIQRDEELEAVYKQEKARRKPIASKTIANN